MVNYNQMCFLCSLVLVVGCDFKPTQTAKPIQTAKPTQTIKANTENKPKSILGFTIGADLETNRRECIQHNGEWNYYHESWIRRCDNPIFAKFGRSNDVLINHGGLDGLFISYDNKETKKELGLWLNYCHTKFGEPAITPLGNSTFEKRDGFVYYNWNWRIDNGERGFDSLCYIRVQEDRNYQPRVYNFSVSLRK